MKKLIAFAIAAIMVLSMIPVMTFGTSAAADEGFWTTLRDPKEYQVNEEKDEPFKPAPGYSYTAEGFTTTEHPADYTGTTPKFTVQTTKAQSLKAGVYMKVRVDDFTYEGVDAWLSFNLSDRPMIENGGTKHGNNWTTLIRHIDTTVHAMSFITTQDTDTKTGLFDHKGNVEVTPEIDADGKEIYTFEVVWDDAQQAYQLLVCGVAVTGSITDETTGNIDKTITNALNGFEVGDQFYVGFTLHSGAKDAAGNITILEYGNNADDAEIPEGNDSKEAEENLYFYAEAADPDTVPANTPALLFDADLTTMYREPSVSNLVMTAQGDKSYKLSTSAQSSYFLWSIMNSVSYNLEDFPVFTMVLKDYYGADGGLFYYAGDELAASDTYRETWTAAAYYGEAMEYTLVQVDLTDKLTGRINGLRPDFVIDTSDAESMEWTLCFAGMFRSLDEAMAYTEAYLTAKGVDVTETTPGGSDDVDDPTDETAGNTTGDDKSNETTDNGSNNGTADTTADTTANTTNSASGDKKDDSAKEDEGGCGGVITVGAVAILAAAAAAVALKKKD